MLQLSAFVINRPVLSLRTGGQIATALKPIVNPNNLKIEGFYCQDSRDKKKQLILVAQDIRETLQDGFVVNDYDVLVEPEELIRLKNIIEIGFEPLGKSVVTVSKERVGKVSDYAVESESLYIKKLYVNRSLLRSFTGGQLGIDRTQIVEITNRKIVVQDLVQLTPAGTPAGIPAV